MKSLNVVLYAVSLVLSMSPALGPAWAENPSVDEMVCALDPQCAMPFADRRLRGITASPAIRPPASFDITLNFPYNSAELTPDSRAKLDRVAKALTDPSTIKLEIIVSGHTDARGSADYNQVLSERRAEAVRTISHQRARHRPEAPGRQRLWQIQAAASVRPQQRS